MLEIKEIETERLSLRFVKNDDSDSLFEIFGDKETCLNDGGYLPFLEKNENFYNMISEMILNKKHYAITLKSSGKVIGLIHFEPIENNQFGYELGFSMNKNFRQKGYMKEALISTITKYFEQTKIEYFKASHIKGNSSSEKTLKSAGFVFKKVHSKALKHAEIGDVDLIEYEKSRNGNNEGCPHCS